MSGFCPWKCWLSEQSNKGAECLGAGRGSWAKGERAENMTKEGDPGLGPREVGAL